MAIKVGDPLPSVEVSEREPGNKVNIAELFAGKTGILFAVPGAFTPGCSKVHLPGYVDDYEMLKSKGVDVIACISVNDAYVMEAWGNSQNATGKIRLLADASGKFTNAIGLAMDSESLGGLRSQRYSMVIRDGAVHALNLEPGGKGLNCSLAKNIASQL